MRQGSLQTGSEPAPSLTEVARGMENSRANFLYYGLSALRVQYVAISTATVDADGLLCRGMSADRRVSVDVQSQVSEW